MAKRKYEESQRAQQDEVAKRYKPSNGEPTLASDVHTARDLRALFFFQQDAVDELRGNLRTFKDFLDSILYPVDEEIVPRRRAILREFLDTEKPREDDEEGVYLSDLLQAWSFSQSSNNDNLFSAVASAFAQLVRTLSSHIDFREHGRGLCRTVLHAETLKLVARGLSAPKHKDSVIGPCLRLMTEVVSFDGGALASQLYSRRDTTFDSQTLARNLSLRSTKEEVVEDAMKRPTIRMHAVRYLLANFRYQNEGAKIDILKQGNVLGSLFHGIQDDPAPLIVDVLSCLKQHVVKDRTLPRVNKGYMFNYRNLEHLYQLYRADLSQEPISPTSASPKDHVIEFVRLICTSPEAGVLRSSTAWYLPVFDTDVSQELQRDEDALQIAYEFDETERYHEKGERLPVRNRTLGDFIQLLRPYANESERQLLLHIFQAAPELVADYFFRKRSFSFDPKLTATWIGYSSTVFSIILLPVPRYFGQRGDFSSTPPPVVTSIESILPLPLTAKALTKCINQSSELIALFAIRILTVAFTKLQKVLKLFHEVAESENTTWKRAAERLTTVFSRRCPRMSDVIAAFRKLPKDKLVQRDAITRLVSLYYEVTPQTALEEKFDISVALATALQDANNSKSENGEQAGMKLLELDSLLRIARWSPGISWWSKQSMPVSPFTALLKLAASQANPSSDITSLLRSIVRDSGVMHVETSPNALEAFVASLRTLDSSAASTDLFNFVDDCFQRFSKRPIKYEDDLDAMRHSSKSAVEETQPLSLIMMVIIEQWPHCQKLEKSSASLIGTWIARLTSTLSKTVHEDENLLLACKEQITKSTTDKTTLKTVKAAFDEAPLPLATEPGEDAINGVNKASTEKYASHESAFKVEDFGPASEDSKHRALLYLSKPNVDLEAAIADGHLASLFHYLSSPTLSIRRQTTTLLQQLCARYERSTEPDAPQIALLTRELLETSRTYTPADSSQPPTQSNQHTKPPPQIQTHQQPYPLPKLTTTLAAHALTVLTDPTHPIYPKLNTFLLRGPSWSPPRLPGYLSTAVLRRPPSDAEDHLARWRELRWLLEWIFAGIGGLDDLQALRAGGIFERILALWNVPELARYRSLGLGDSASSSTGHGAGEAPEGPSKSSSGRVRSAAGTSNPLPAIRPLIAKIIARAVCIEGGVGLLVSKAGILAWLSAARVGGTVDQAGVEVLGVLDGWIRGRCERLELGGWSDGIVGGEGKKGGDEGES